jgi:phosphatidate cytidylyltransferase
VRLIGGDEAAEALERGDAQGRLSEDEPRFGDRPPAPSPDEPRPTLRFPLASSDDPATFERPAAAPVPPRTESPELSHWAGSANEEVPKMSRRDARGSDRTWSSPAGPGPRWRDDEPHQQPQQPPPPGREPRGQPSGQPLQGSPLTFEEGQEPPPGRSVFGDVDDEPAYDDEGYPEGGYAEPGYDEPAYADNGHAVADEYGNYYDEEYDPEYDDYYDEADQTYAAAPRGGRVGLRQARSAGRLRTGRHRGADRDLRVAIAVGVAFGALAIALLRFGGPVGGMVLVVPVVAYATYELMVVLHRAGFQPLLPVAVAAGAGLPLAAYNYGEQAIPLALVLTTVVGFVWYLINAGGERPVANLGATLLGVLWIGGLGSFAALLLSAPHGVALFLAALLPTIGYDVGGLFVGRSAGSRALSSVSPNKTVEGLAGGMILALVVGVVYAAVGVNPFDGIGDGLVIGLVVALSAPLGDLTESLVKRDLDVKDMGQILPGHGGLLDRFDALLFVLPAMWYVARMADFFLT